MNEENIMEFAQAVGNLSEIEYMRAKELIEAESRECNCNCDTRALSKQIG